MGDVATRVVLYVRAGCHLCDDARQVVASASAAAGTGWVEIDVDTADDDGALRREYGEQVPVVVVDGVQRGYWRIDPARVAKALREPR